MRQVVGIIDVQCAHTCTHIHTHAHTHTHTHTDTHTHTHTHTMAMQNTKLMTGNEHTLLKCLTYVYTLYTVCTQHVCQNVTLYIPT